MNYNLKPLSVNCDKNDNMVEMILFITRSETEKLKYIRGSLFNWGHFSSRRVCSFLWKLHLFFVGKGSFLTSNNNQGSAIGLFDQSIHKSSNQIVVNQYESITLAIGLLNSISMTIFFCVALSYDIIGYMCMLTFYFIT